MYWNHRILKKIDGKGTQFEEPFLYVVEMYYNEDDSIIGWTEDKTVYGSDLDEVKQTLEWMLDALTKPVLDEEVLLAEINARPEEPDEDLETYLTLDEVLDSLGLEREDLSETVVHEDKSPKDPKVTSIADADKGSTELGF